MDRRKKKLLVLAVVILLMALFSGTALAYYSVTGTATNVITSGNLRMKILETDGNGDPFPQDGMTVLPGDTIEKRVSVQNICQQPFWLRVELVKGSSKEALSAEDALQFLNLNQQDWTLHDGYYYYNTILPPQECTQPLFTQVHIPGELVKLEDAGTVLTVTIKASAVQSKNNPAQQPWEASGWPES